MKYIQTIKDIDDNFIINLLQAKGIENVQQFLCPTKELELNPSLLDNIEQSVQFIHDNLDSSFGLLVDCDTDGYCSAAILYLYLKSIKPDIKIKYFVHTGKQHGLEDTFEIIEDSDINVLLIPDASSNDFKYHEILGKQGIKSVVFDHHECDSPISQYCILVNNQLGEYNNRTLSGAGVVYKFCELYDEYYGYKFAQKFIDLAAVAIIGDMMNLTNLETRYIVSEGLKHINNPFLLALIEKQSYSIKGILTPTSIAFYIVPLINALIRVGKDTEKQMLFEAFVNGEQEINSLKRGAKPGDKEYLIEAMARSCTNAKNRQDRGKKKAADIIDMEIEKNGLNNNKIITIILDEYDIDTTLTGLLAMQTVSKYKKPVYILRTVTEDKKQYYRGSGRGLDKSGLQDLKQFTIDSGLCEYAEGHANAHGVSFPVANLDAYIQYANDKLKDIDFNEGIYNVDFIKSVNYPKLEELILSLAQYQTIWGKGIEEPYIVVENITLRPEDVSYIGNNNDTVKFNINGIEFIKFKDEDFVKQLQKMKQIGITILGTANINNWMGKDTPQLYIKDYNLHDSYFDF